MTSLGSTPNFIVSHVTPLILENNQQNIEVSGYSLSEVKKCIYKTRGHETELTFKLESEDYLLINLSAIIQENSLFFIFLYDEKESLLPIGPFITKTSVNKISSP